MLINEIFKKKKFEEDLKNKCLPDFFPCMGKTFGTPNPNEIVLGTR